MTHYSVRNLVEMNESHHFVCRVSYYEARIRDARVASAAFCNLGCPSPDGTTTVV